MNLEQALASVAGKQPQIIHLSGKTSTGKSTFAKKLSEQFGYKLIELDLVVRDSVINALNLQDEGQAFVNIYKNRTQHDLIELFMSATKTIIQKHLDSGEQIIIDGAISNMDTLQELLGDYPDVSIIYLHPEHLDIYERNLKSRFQTTSKTNRGGLPDKFWELIDPQEFDMYCSTRILSSSINQAIEHYAKDSQIESTKRLANMTAHFNNVTTVTI